MFVILKLWLSFAAPTSPLLPSWQSFLGKWIFRFCGDLIWPLVTDATALGLAASDRVGYVNTVNEQMGSDNRSLSDKIMTLYNAIRTIRCYQEWSTLMFLHLHAEYYEGTKVKVLSFEATKALAVGRGIALPNLTFWRRIFFFKF